MALSDQSIPASGFAPYSMNNRTVSAPYSSTIVPGLTVLPRDLLIFACLFPRAASQVGHFPPFLSTWYSILHSLQNGAGAFNIP